ncbi:Protein of unknown function [Micromonospora pattaloongensis]|uniref:DUF3618 domain-containing protein n=1 Tax=Micromonospora pattaloongensis TaxID=405436 RepID=A0A1H3R8E0_9ACTN|nr:DUF3618 domain-containing protein [Micromonospora pattaloongensis]SDZ22054.1 Protein of unknown function [Micromonospora pattaloongensis]
MTNGDAEAARAQVRRTRAELAETVQALAAQVDVKARGRQTAMRAAGRARELAMRAGDAARQRAAGVARRGTSGREPIGRRASRTTGTARRVGQESVSAAGVSAFRVGAAIRRNRAAVAAIAAAGAIVAAALRRQRRQQPQRVMPWSARSDGNRALRAPLSAWQAPARRWGARR